MQKRLAFFCAVLCLIMTIASIGICVYIDRTQRKIIKEGETNENIIEELERIREYITKLPTDKVRVKITATGQIKEMTMNEYLLKVLPAEMPPYYEIEALKAQAVIARTYAYEKMSRNAHGDCDVCDNYAHCQAYVEYTPLMGVWERRGYDEELRKTYYEKIRQAVYDTNNICAIYNNEYIKGYFHACSGGKTESVSEIWGKQQIPYLVSVESPGEEEYVNYTSRVNIQAKELETKLNKSNSKQCDITRLYNGKHVKILSYTSTGRVDSVEIGGSIFSANELRSLLGLKSTNFTIEESGEEVTFNVKGYGHGVGMSQVGANAMAQNNSTWQEIVKHYYTGVELVYNVTKENI